MKKRGWENEKTPENQCITEKFRGLKVPEIGIEPIHPCEWQILSLLRLPIPPPGHCQRAFTKGTQYYGFRLFYPKYVLSIFSGDKNPLPATTLLRNQYLLYKTP